MWDQEAIQEPPSEFVTKLYQILDSPSYHNIIRWSDSLDSFVILDPALFQQLVIPQVFKHSNFASFVRQLNKYDFHKVRFKHPQSKAWEFKHPDFRPENRNRANLIKRKGTAAKRPEISPEISSQIQDITDVVTTRLTSLENNFLRLQAVVEELQEEVTELKNSKSSDIGSTQEVVKIEQHGLRALIAMDDATSREICSNFVSQYGCIVDTVSNGLDVVRRAEAAHYDYILIDVVLSTLDGLSATDIIRQTNKTSAIIVCTEKCMMNSPKIESYLHRGASAVLVRPFTKAELFRQLDALRPNREEL